LDIVSIGNANIDILAIVDRFPLEDEKIIIKTLEKYAGGSASNFAVSASRHGLKSGFMGFIGDDIDADFLLNEFRKENVDIKGVTKKTNSSTGFALLLTKPTGDHVSISHRGANDFLKPVNIDKNLVKRAKIAHFSSITNEVLLSTAKICNETKIKLSLDPGINALSINRKEIEEVFSQTDFLFLNKLEFEKIIGKKPTIKTVSVFQELSKGIVSIQLGKEGSLVINKDEVFKINSFDVDVTDTTGAGDTYSSAFIAGIINGYSLKQAGIYASASAGLKCRFKGARTGMPTRKEVLSFLQKQGFNFEV